VAILESAAEPPSAERKEQRVPGCLEAIHAPSTARHQTPRCSLLASPLRQSGQTPKALCAPSQSNPSMQGGGRAGALSASLLESALSQGWGVVHAQACKVSGSPAQLWHQAMPLWTSEGVRQAHLGELAPHARPSRMAVQSLGWSFLSFLGLQETAVAKPPQRKRQTWNAALKSRQLLRKPHSAPWVGHHLRLVERSVMRDTVSLPSLLAWSSAAHHTAE
jgi:hypothetical protein